MTTNSATLYRGNVTPLPAPPPPPMDVLNDEVGILALLAALADGEDVVGLSEAATIIAAHHPYPYVQIALAIARGLVAIDPPDALADDIETFLRRR